LKLAELCHAFCRWPLVFLARTPSVASRRQLPPGGSSSLSKSLPGRCRRARWPSDCKRIAGLCRAGGAVSASAETIPYIFHGHQPWQIVKNARFRRSGISFHFSKKWPQPLFRHTAAPSRRELHCHFPCCNAAHTKALPGGSWQPLTAVCGSTRRLLCVHPLVETEPVVPKSPEAAEIPLLPMRADTGTQPRCIVFSMHRGCFFGAHPLTRPRPSAMIKGDIVCIQEEPFI